MGKEFSTTSAFISNQHNQKILYPFGPPIFQTSVSNGFINLLLDEGNNLKENCEHLLAGNMAYGQSLSYDQEFIKKHQTILISHAREFINFLAEHHGSGIINFDPDTLYLESLWINFMQQHDFNPSHFHNGLLSFVIFLDIPEEIFTVQTKSPVKDAGKIVFEFGENICDFMNSSYKITPYNGLMLIFPSKLRHYVPPFWTKDQRISVSGNFFLK
jgi:uncharacterized protein (TIGR02466 family)